MRRCLLALALLAGCGHSIDSRKDYENVYIQGKVTINSQPMTAGSVTFVTENGKTYKGFIWRDGQYEVYNTKPGLAKIVVNGVEQGFQGPGLGGVRSGRNLPPAQPVKLPPQYAAASTTPLTYTITSTSQKHDIDIKIDAEEWTKLNPNVPVPVAPKDESTASEAAPSKIPTSPAKNPTLPEKAPGK